MGSDKDCGWEGNRRFDHVLRILTACIFMCKFNDIQEGHEHLAYGSHTWYSILFFIFWLTCAYAATSHYYVVCVRVCDEQTRTHAYTGLSNASDQFIWRTVF